MSISPIELAILQTSSRPDLTGRTPIADLNIRAKVLAEPTAKVEKTEAPKIDGERVLDIADLAIRNAPIDLQTYLTMLNNDHTETDEPLFIFEIGELKIPVREELLLTLAHLVGPALVGERPVEELFGTSLGPLSESVLGEYIEPHLVTALAQSQFTERGQGMRSKAWTLKRTLEIMYAKKEDVTIDEKQDGDEKALAKEQKRMEKRMKIV